MQTFLTENRKIRIVLIFFYMIIPLLTFGQENDVDFVIRKIKQNYPGYLTKTVRIDFDKWARIIAEKNKEDTFKALALITRFFKDQHLQIYDLREHIVIDTANCRNNVHTVRSYLDGIKRKKKYEGYWLSERNDCIVGLVYNTKFSHAYEAYVIESRDATLIPGQLIAKMVYCGKDTYITDYHSPTYYGRQFLNSVFRSDTVLITAPDEKWKRLYKYNSSIIEGLPEWSFKATGHSLDKNCYLINLPKSSLKNASLIDSIIHADSVIIANTRTLIIDIRGNTGGRSAAYYPLLPWIYTNPIIKPSASTYATEDRIDRYLQEIDKLKEAAPLTPEDQKEVDDWVKKLHDNIGHFIPNDADTVKFTNIRHYPQEVAVVINYACQSAAELLLLTFMQSKKVKLFGEHTMGAVDYLDVYYILTPSQKYTLYIPTSKRQFDEKGSLDGKGIAPQVPIGDDEPDWIKFVMRYYEKI